MKDARQVRTFGPLRTDLASDYIRRKRAVVDAGFEWEICWQSARARRPPSQITSASLLQEHAWVVLSTGMAESVVRAVFPRFAHALHDFHPDAIVVDRQASSFRARAVFNHERKVDAIVEAAAMLNRTDLVDLVELLHRDTETFLRGLPYIGPVTWRHLAKNLGQNIVKPDRHLTRLARAAGLPVDEMCDQISAQVGDCVAVVDIVLWRSCVLR